MGDRSSAQPAGPAATGSVCPAATAGTLRTGTVVTATRLVAIARQRGREPVGRSRRSRRVISIRPSPPRGAYLKALPWGRRRLYATNRLSVSPHSWLASVHREGLRLRPA